jgi:hypothetical protein
LCFIAQVITEGVTVYETKQAENNASKLSISADKQNNFNKNKGEGNRKKQIEIINHPRDKRIAYKICSINKSIGEHKHIQHQGEKKYHPPFTQLILARCMGVKKGNLGRKCPVAQHKGKDHDGIASEKGIQHGQHYTLFPSIFGCNCGICLITCYVI